MSLVGVALTKVYQARGAIGRCVGGSSTAPEARAETLLRDGVVVVDSSLTPPIVDRLRRLGEGFFDCSRPAELIYSPDGKALHPVEGARPEDVAQFYFLHIKNYHLKADALGELLPAIGPILSSYYRSRFYVRDVYCYRTQPVPRSQGSYEWHVDNYPPGSLKVIVYLTDVPLKLGPFAYAAGSHRGYRPDLGLTGRRYEDAFVRARFAARECVGGPGTAIIFDNNGIHRATPPTAGHRDVISCTLFPSVFRSGGRRALGLDLARETSVLKKYTK